MTPILTILAILAGIYAILCIVVVFAQTRILYVGGQMTPYTPSMPPFQWKYEDVLLDVGSEKTKAWFMPVENARGAVIFSHGNAGALSDWFEAAMPFRTLGFSVLMYDYGGYGDSTGRSSEQRCYADIRAMWKFLTVDRGMPPEKILLFGRSLGGGATAQLATEVSPGAVILESTFSSVPELAGEIFRIFPMRLLIWNRFDTFSKIRNIHAPILVVHSPDDTLVPYRHAKANFERANEPKQFLEIRGDHNDGVFISAEVYQEGLAQFVGKYFAVPPGA